MAKNLTLEQLSASIHEELLKKSPSSTLLSDSITSATGGSKEKREFVIGEIYRLLASKHSSTVTEDTIDSLIKEYHINYFNPIYTGELKGLEQLLNSSFLITSNMQFQEKLYHLARIIYQENYGLSVIDGFEFLDGINEVAANRCDYIWVQYTGIKVVLPNLKFVSNTKFLSVVKKSVSFDSKEDINETNPEILCQRENGSRVTAFSTPYSRYPKVNIRNFDLRFRGSNELIADDVSSEQAERFFNLVQPGRPGIIILGDQSVGKTTYLCRLISTLPDYLAIGTIEPMFELNISKRFPAKNVDELQILPSKDAEACFQSLLRTNRDLIINGEIRSPQEAVVTIKALTRQGRGSMGTFHCTSIFDFLYDYRNLLMQSGFYTSERSAELDIARAVDLIILIKLNRRTGKRFISSISEILYDPVNTKNNFKTQPIFERETEHDTLKPVHNISNYLRKKLCEYDMTDEGLAEIDSIFGGV